MTHLEYPAISALKAGGNANYSLDTVAWDMVESMASAITSELEGKMKQSRYLSVLADENTNISVTKN